MPRWFYGNKRKIGKGNLYLTENRLSWNEMCRASDKHNYMYHTCAKEFFKFELQLSSYWQNINFSRYCPKFHIFTNIVIFICNFLDELLHPHKFYGRDMSGILFFIFASCELLKNHLSVFQKLRHSDTCNKVKSCTKYDRPDQSQWELTIALTDFIYLVCYLLKNNEKQKQETNKQTNKQNKKQKQNKTKTEKQYEIENR